MLIELIAFGRVGAFGVLELSPIGWAHDFVWDCMRYAHPCLGWCRALRNWYRLRAGRRPWRCTGKG